jgi:two-component system, cell cycle sensor histidine kinase and response regulator CckA
LQARTALAVAGSLSFVSAALLLFSILAIDSPDSPVLMGLIGAAAVAAAGAAACAWRARAASAWSSEPIAALGQLLESAEGARAVTDSEGKVIYVNSAGRDWLGNASPLDFLTDHVAVDLDDDDAVSRLRQAAATGLAASAEVPVETESGEPDWSLISVRPIEVVQGLLLWSSEDVTARRTINDILGQERQDLADFLHFLPTGLYSVDVDGAFHFANQRFAAWLGYGPEDLNGMALDDVLVGPNRPQPDGEWQGEVQFKTRTGDVIPALVLQSTFDDAGATRTRTLVVRDGVRREPSSMPGRIAYERFRSLFDVAPMAIAITDPEGAIVDCNKAFEILSNRTRAILVGSHLTDRLISDDRRAFGTELERVLSGDIDGSHLDVRVEGTSVAQTSVFVGPLSAPELDPARAGGDANGPAFRVAENIEGAVAHFIDVTEQKNLEVQFAQAQKMQAMGQLAGGVAHDFNNLLTAMIGFCDLLLQRHAAGDPSFADIMQIKQNSNRAANLVRQLLAFSRKQPLQPKELNVTDALMELSHLLTRLNGESIEFKLVHGRELGVVRVDPGQFDQMIINLAVNARDAMPGGGTLTITTGVDEFSKPTQVGAEQAPPGRYLRVAVSDTGKGIAPENLGRIFEPFFSTKQEIPGAGTGLGLATVYGIVRQTGGFILVDSSSGEGATFNIYLPRISAEVDDTDTAMNEERPDALPEQTGPTDDRRRDETAHAPEVEPPPADLAGTGTVLLVEDEDAVRVFAARALKNKGYKVLQARTGEQALDILRDTADVDLMITDMMMPGMDGGTLARLIRVERPEIRIIIISGYSEEVARGDIVDTADFHFLPKPFSLSQLAGKVKDVLMR